MEEEARSPWKDNEVILDDCSGGLQPQRLKRGRWPLAEKAFPMGSNAIHERTLKSH